MDKFKTSNMHREPLILILRSAGLRTISHIFLLTNSILLRVFLKKMVANIVWIIAVAN